MLSGARILGESLLSTDIGRINEMTGQYSRIFRHVYQAPKEIGESLLRTDNGPVKGKMGQPRWIFTSARVVMRQGDSVNVVEVLIMGSDEDAVRINGQWIQFARVIRRRGECETRRYLSFR